MPESLKTDILQAIKKTGNTVQKKTGLLALPQLVHDLDRELLSGDYRPSCFSCFVVKDPKIREIFSPHYRDRVVHHLLVDRISPFIDKTFIYDSFANRPGKGIHRAADRLRRFMRKEKTSYYLQLDIKSFFPSIDKAILWEIFQKTLTNISAIPEPEKCFLSSLARRTIFQNPVNPFPLLTGNSHLLKEVPKYKSLFHIPPGRGLPIGSLTSQFFANLYLNELDQFIKHRLKVKYYLRYVDDLVLLAERPELLTRWQAEIETFLKEKLKLELHPQKSHLQLCSKGIDFLGYVIREGHVLVRQRSIRAFKRRLYFFNHLLDPLQFPINDPPLTLRMAKRYRTGELAPPIDVTPFILEQFLATINSYYGIFRFANSFNLRRSLYKNHFHGLKELFVPQDEQFLSMAINTRTLLYKDAQGSAVVIKPERNTDG